MAIILQVSTSEAMIAHCSFATVGASEEMIFAPERESDESESSTTVKSISDAAVVEEASRDLAGCASYHNKLARRWSTCRRRRQAELRARDARIIDEEGLCAAAAPGGVMGSKATRMSTSMA